MTTYGYFDDEAREYVITNPRTPVKWINYLGSLAFGGFIDQTGGMLLCRQDPALNRITRYRTQGPPAEFRGTTLYLRTPRAGGGYDVVSPFFVPTLSPLDSFECRVGLGYSTFITVVRGLRVTARVFVPQKEAVLVQQVTVTNLGGAAQDADLIPVVEYSHPDALKQLINADWVPQTMQSHLHEEPGGLKVLSQAPFMNKDRQRNFFTADLPVSSFETDRQAFLGDNGYGGWAAPGSLQHEELGDSLALRGDNIAALMLHLGAIPAGESRSAVVLLGQAGSIEEALPLIRHFREPAKAEAAFEQHRKFWDDLLSVAQVQTQFGLARNAWLTGTASWMYQAGLKYILGIHPEYDGLRVDPCIPAEWDGFRVRRRFRGAMYDIRVTNPEHVRKGVRAIRVDGVTLSRMVLPVFWDEGTHTIDVVLG